MSGSANNEKISLRKKLLIAILYLLSGIAFVSGALHLTICDQIPYLASIYYALPLPIVCLQALFSLLLLLKLKHKKASLIAACFLITCGLGLYFLEWNAAKASTSSVHPREESIRIATWNIMGSRLGATRIAKEIASWDADLVALTETGELEEKQEVWAEELPNHRFVPLGKGLSLLIRGSIDNAQLIELTKKSRLAVVEVRAKGKYFELYIADISPRLFPSSRKEALEKIGKRVAKNDSGNHILLGDFNTPRRSTHFSEIRKKLNSCAENSQSGFAYTWPMPLPLLELDQIWISQKAEVLSWRKKWTSASDHLAIIVEAQFP